MLRVAALAAVLPLVACAPLHAGVRPSPTAPSAFDFTAPPAHCSRINGQRSTWGAAGKVAGAVASACVAGGGLYAAFERDGLNQRDAVALATCAAVAGGVVLFSASKAEALAHEWAETCSAPASAAPVAQ